MAPLRALLEDATVRKTAQNAKYDMLALRRAGITLRGLDFDTMLASYVLDPGRRSHGLDVLALEFLDHTMTSYEELCGKGKAEIPFDACPIEGARDYSCEDADMTLRLRERLRAAARSARPNDALQEIEMPLVGVLADMEWAGVAIDLAWFASLKERFERERERVEQEIYVRSGRRVQHQLESTSCARSSSTSCSCPCGSGRRPARRPTRACSRSSPTQGTRSRSC